MKKLEQFFTIFPIYIIRPTIFILKQLGLFYKFKISFYYFWKNEPNLINWLQFNRHVSTSSQSSPTPTFQTLDSTSLTRWRRIRIRIRTLMAGLPWKGLNYILAPHYRHCCHHRCSQMAKIHILRSCSSRTLNCWTDSRRSYSCSGIKFYLQRRRCWSSKSPQCCRIHRHHLGGVSNACWYTLPCSSILSKNQSELCQSL